MNLSAEQEQLIDALRQCMAAGIGNGGDDWKNGNFANAIGRTESLISKVLSNQATHSSDLFNRSIALFCSEGEVLCRSDFNILNNYFDIGYKLFRNSRLTVGRDDINRIKPNQSITMPTDGPPSDGGGGYHNLKELIDLIADTFKGNYRSRFMQLGERALDALGRQPIDRLKEHYDDLVRFQVELAPLEKHHSEPAPQWREPASEWREAAKTRVLLSDIIETLSGISAPSDEYVPIDKVTKVHLRAARDQVVGLRNSKSTPEQAHVALERLDEEIEEAVDNSKLHIGLLHDRTETARLRLKSAFSAAYRQLALAIGYHASSARPGVVFASGQGPIMVVIGWGRFWMGSSDDETERLQIPPDAARWERPRREVEVAKFAMSKCTLSADEFGAFCEMTGRRRPSDEGWGDGGLPAVNLSWRDADDYCRWLSEASDGYEYRLPSEAEWEYACRAGTETAYSFGDELSNLRAQSQENSMDARTSTPRPAPVDSIHYPPNAFGLHQMHGNVWEWCADDFEPNYQRRRSSGPNDGAEKVVRGGSWNEPRAFLRSAQRMKFPADAMQKNIGFRIAMSLTHGSSGDSIY